ncbi:MAG: DUF4956 domain-containing protein [Clostridia bacterium]|nr:DUF4956 domain-containing protein [Clostridia bacterium]
MSFTDIFKNSFLESFSSNQADSFTILLTIFLSAVFGVFIFFIYKAVTKKTFYVNSFNVSLVAMSVITAAIIVTIQSNIVLSLGMVGALSIVRFRTAIKDPLDLVFLYWSLSAGIICGAGFAFIAAVLSVAIAAIVFVLQKYPVKKSAMILVVNSSKFDADKEIISIVKEFSKVCTVKSKSLASNSLDMVIEVKVDEESEIVHKVMEVSGVVSASLISHDGEINA